ncbi:hypothetical protein [Actinoplanes sp. N902-109]|uniref:hypothetical protein n=1 Tax=Actinoplanes sp. (strain N902-109) TaxID=649831 RepID=UPI00032959A9|nr:hypothetical protein [Actinoplanes sp. N902-109]AGL18378.1 hypothetical protein L083_4868 [Actinoplanes sp. N902-109]
MNPLLYRLVWAGTSLSALAVLLGPAPVSVPGGLLLGFVLPGAALTGALLRRRELTTVERIALAPALSMATLVVTGLLLYVCRVPLDRSSWTAATAGVSVLGLLATALRRPAPETGPSDAGPPDAEPLDAGPLDAGAPAGGPVPVGPVPEMADAHTIVMSVVPPARQEVVAAEYRAKRARLVRQSLPLLLVVAVLGGASWLSLRTSAETSRTTVTALSAAPASPVNSAGNRTVVVSASGLAAAEGPYTVRVSAVAGRTARTRTVAVTGAGTWSETMTVPGGVRVTIGLYRSGDTTAYRSISVSATE